MHKSGSHGVLLIATAAGLILGGFVWPPIGRTSTRLVMVASALITGVACVGAVAIDRVPEWHTPLAHGDVFAFALAALGGTGIINASALYVVGRTSDDERPACLAVTGLIIDTIRIALATGMAALAHLRDVVWPIFIIFGLCLLAALAALRLGQGPHAHAAPAGVAA